MATLTVTHTETLILNGKEVGSNNTFNITGVDMVYSRIMKSVASATTTLVAFKATESTSDSAISVAEAKYIRITNLDSTNAVNLGLDIDDGSNGADQNCTILLGAGQTFVMGVAANGIQAHDADTGITTGALDNLESIAVNGGSNSVSLEVFVAGTEG
tara:strand:- start:4075 stop:4548 length:474 start_codon:yes stop_codon:yes gene_type:complete